MQTYKKKFHSQYESTGNYVAGIGTSGDKGRDKGKKPKQIQRFFEHSS
jgi:hypothetical protein